MPEHAPTEHPSKLKIPELTANAAIDLALDTINLKKQALIFVGTKRGAEKTAEDISKKLKISDAFLGELADKILNALSRPTTQCERLANCIKKGIAFHHAGLVQKQRELIEDSFRQGSIRIICCTPTLAAGLDLPAFRSIIKDLRRYGKHGFNFIPVLEYQQMSGRAGRPKHDKFGEAITIAGTEGAKDDIIDTFINGAVEDIFSKLAVEPVLRTYLLSLIASDFVRTKQQIMDFFEQTFWAHQFKDMKKLEKTINKMLKLLEDCGFIKTIAKQDDFVPAHELDKNDENRIIPTLVGKRVSELYIDPLTANYVIKCLQKACLMNTKPFSFLQMISNTAELKPLLRTKAKELDEIQGVLNKNGDFLLEPEPSMFEENYNDFIDSVKTAFFFNEWIDEKDEEYLMEKYGIRPGEIHIKLENADWILYSAEELAKLLKLQKLLKDIIKLRIRMKYGAKEELLPLLQLKNIGRARARRMFAAGIKDIADVKKADLSTLNTLVGKGIAVDVKKQVGQDFEKAVVPENKRKGQISLKDY